jgi:hypothetical protein
MSNTGLLLSASLASVPQVERHTPGMTVYNRHHRLYNTHNTVYKMHKKPPPSHEPTVYFVNCMPRYRQPDVHDELQHPTFVSVQA